MVILGRSGGGSRCDGSEVVVVMMLGCGGGDLGS